MVLPFSSFLNSDPLERSNKKKRKKQVLVVSNDDVAQLRSSLESYEYCGMSFRGGRAKAEKGKSGRRGGRKEGDMLEEKKAPVDQFGKVSLLFFLLLLLSPQNSSKPPP